MLKKVLRDSIIIAAKGPISCDLAGEVAILDVKYGTYYGLNAVGARIWNLIQEPKTVNEIRDILLKEYEVETECCEREVLALLQNLVAKELIEIEDEKAP
jgi:Coenzyme PQQ synthesis protein D (PqqD)